MLIYLLIFLLLLIAYFAYNSMGKDIVSPAVLFDAPFVAACICAAVYANKWELNMSFDTFLVILSGCFLYTVICWLVHNSKRFRMKRRRLHQFELEKNQIYVSGFKIILVILLQLLSLYVVVNSMRQAVAKMGVSGSLSTVMYYFRNYHMFTEYDVNISSLASNLRTFSIAVSYIWIYIICNNLVCKKKCKNLILLLISVILGFANSVILGARGEAIQLVVAIVIIYCILRSKYNNWKIDINFKQILMIAIIAFALMFFFQATGDMLGRSTVVKYDVSAVDEVAKYLGAEIKNLDIYLENIDSWKKTFPGSYTFGSMLSWIAKWFDLDWKIQSTLPFQKINGISLGNVYTLFYSYINDFGFVGNIIMVCLMAFISQVTYELVPNFRRKTNINVGIIIYSYVGFLIVFSFFGERFFNYLINISMVKYIFVWIIMCIFVDKFRVKIRI